MSRRLVSVVSVVSVVSFVSLAIALTGCPSKDERTSVAPAPEKDRPRPEKLEPTVDPSLLGVWRSNETMRLMRAVRVGSTVEFRAADDWEDTGYSKDDLRFTLVDNGDGTYAITETVKTVHPKSMAVCTFVIAPTDAPRPLSAKMMGLERLWIRIATWTASVSDLGTCTATTVTGNVEQMLEKISDAPKE